MIALLSASYIETFSKVFDFSAVAGARDEYAPFSDDGDRLSPVRHTASGAGGDGGRQGQCLNCQAILNIPMQMMAPAAQPVGAVAASQFDEGLADYRLAPEPTPPVQSQINLNAYATPQAPQKDYSGFWGMEKRALDAGVLGGLGLMLGAAVWFVLGLMADRIFFYPPVLFIIGLVAFVRGIANSIS